MDKHKLLPKEGVQNASNTKLGLIIVGFCVCVIFLGSVLLNLHYLSRVSNSREKEESSVIRKGHEFQAANDQEKNFERDQMTARRHAKTSQKIKNMISFGPSDCMSDCAEEVMDIITDWVDYDLDYDDCDEECAYREAAASFACWIDDIDYDNNDWWVECMTDIVGDDCTPCLCDDYDYLNVCSSFKREKRINMRKGQDEDCQDCFFNYTLSNLFVGPNSLAFQIEQEFPDDCDDTCTVRTLSLALVCGAEHYPDNDLDEFAGCLVDNVGDECKPCACDIMTSMADDDIDVCDDYKGMNMKVSKKNKIRNM